MLSSAAISEIIDGLWLSVTSLLNETNRLKKHSRSQRDYDAVISERVTPRLVALDELIDWLPTDRLSDTAQTRLAAIRQGMDQLKEDQHRQLDADLLKKRNLDREEGRISRHRRF
ncbi:hypothetical protein [Furfurilactobacillus rossiae]|uniref:Uncharacterized protein n=1 Tax=Furfurilactobacillus rossiae DSM 15814 TaxID=1114972 RepID=A0A0R1RH33_9LACO|nr:hypothetical protein [Furfurilactobacillus rossiae]KRL53602.1 hypothetical protein FD35_GL000967 [Furfurilactobacillus rossiae DSM 15814]QFR67535.1 hypothetical protein LR814_10645 [Furfurilactobacillus rossiae]QLE60486.1 hypothetical protein LROSRS0_0438 [Furfurilactobacillus rossiae]